MKKKLKELPEDIEKAIMVGVQDYIDMVDEYDFDTDSQVGTIINYKLVSGDFAYGDSTIYWEAEITFEITASYSHGDYYTPSSYDIDSISATDIDLLYVSIANEEEYIFVEFEK